MQNILTIAFSALLAILIVGSCGRAQQSLGAPPAPLGGTPSYFRDLRSGLCFAGWNVGNSYQSITNVPCTPAVMTLSGGFKK